MPQSHGTRRRSAASQQSRSSRHRAPRRGGAPAAPRHEETLQETAFHEGPYPDGAFHGGPPRPPVPPRRRGTKRRLARRILTSNATIAVVAIGVLMAAVVMVDLEELSGQKAKPPAIAETGLSTNDMLAVMSGSDIDAVSADAIATAKKRAYEEHQRELKELREKAKRDAAARAKLKAQQERERLARSNPSSRQNKAYGKRMNELKGWGECWPSLETLWDHESNWNERAENPSSGAYGIPQSLPGSKMASAGADWRTSSPTQIAWGLGYIKARYKDPCGAWAFWQRNNWY